jgi:hypothetical protein
VRVRLLRHAGVKAFAEEGLRGGAR